MSSSKKRAGPAKAEPRSNYRSSPPTITPRWIAAAFVGVFAAAALCLWGTLCFTFWQGSWQLLYHPKTAITQTPADAGLDFDSIDFATTDAGQPQLHGWWIQGPPGSRFTAIYLHGTSGNIGDVIPALAPLHAAKLNLLVFDYRGYGKSRFARPSEARWREDTESAIHYLTATRHLSAGSIVLVGSGLGANLALEVAAVHPELAGVVLEDPAESPEDAVFNDPRARLVPAHWLVHDRWYLVPAATALHIPSLWLEAPVPKTSPHGINREAYDKVAARKVRVWLTDSAHKTTEDAEAVSRWLDDLAPNAQTH